MTSIRGKRTLLTLLATTLLVPVALQGQARGPGGDGPGTRGIGIRDRAPAAERVLAVREHLQLRDDQLQELEEMRREAVDRRMAALGEVEELRSRVRAGDLARDELRAHVRERFEVAREVREQDRDRLERLLDEGQIEAWRELQRERFAGRRGERRREMRQGGSGRRGPGGI